MLSCAILPIIGRYSLSGYYQPVATALASSRLSDFLARDIFIKRYDLIPRACAATSCAEGFSGPDALCKGADTLLTAGAIQSNHVRQTAVLAAKLELHCVVLL